MKTKTRWASYILALVLALSFGSLTVAGQEKTTGGKASSRLVPDKPPELLPNYDDCLVTFRV